MVDTQEKTKAIEPRPNLAMTKSGFAPTTIEEAWRFSEALAQSEMVPDKYRGKPRDCLVVLDLSARLHCSWLTIMQHVYSVHGRIGMESALVTALVNQSGLFVDPLEYEVRGDDVSEAGFAVRAYAKRKSTGTVLYGPWIDWKLVKAEGWDKKNGSKWLTMPEQMFHYRAASWFKSRHCPEVTMGMMSTEEAEEIPLKHVDSVTFDQAQTEAAETIKTESGSEIIETPLDPLEADSDDDTQAKVEAAKKKLREAEANAKPTKGKGKTKKDKDVKSKYTCKCGHNFDVANATDVIKGNQCPKCFSFNVTINNPETQNNGAPEWAED